MTNRMIPHAVLGAVLFATAVLGALATAQSPSSDALTGTVRSRAEGAMEGVVVIAQRGGSTILTAVTTDDTGRYRFPRTRLAAGSYTIQIRAAGFVLPGDTPASVTVGEGPATLDLQLESATRDQFARQLTTVDWLTSMPGTEAQKDLLVRKVVNCGFCHEMGRVMRTRYTADELMPVIARMGTYAADNSSACGTKSVLQCDPTTSGRVQVQSMAQPAEGLSYGGADAKLLAHYLASVNLSGGRSTWDFPLKAMPRPKGKATRAIVTVFPVPRQPSVIHDLGVDPQGNVWYGDSGWGYLGKLDPRTAQFTEYQAPQTWPDPNPGFKRLIGVQDVEADATGKVWAVIGFRGPKMAYFDSNTGKWSTFDMPAPVWAFLPAFHKGQAGTSWTTGQVKQADGTAPLKAYRLNAKTGAVDAGHPIMVDSAGKDFSGPKQLGVFGYTSPMAPFCYQIERDPDDNFICADFYGSNIIVVNAKTGKTRNYPTPTPNAAPRRGRADDQGRFWFGEFWGDRLGLFDPATQSIREFPYSTKYMSAYAGAPDRNGEGWGSSIGSDRVVRVNPKTGETTEYLMPVYYDSRKVVVDPSTKNTTVWLPNKNLAQLIRIEPQD